MDETRRRLERLARIGDPVARKKLSNHLRRQKTGAVTFRLFSNAARRTRQRWHRHLEGRCSFSCRFCRRIAIGVIK